MNDDLDDVRLRHRIHARRAEGSDMIGWAAHRDRGVLLAKVDRLTEALRSIAYEGGGCLAVEGGARVTCGVCAVCWAREALEGGAA